MRRRMLKKTAEFAATVLECTIRNANIKKDAAVTIVIGNIGSATVDDIQFAVYLDTETADYDTLTPPSETVGVEPVKYNYGDETIKYVLSVHMPSKVQRVRLTIIPQLIKADRSVVDSVNRFDTYFTVKR